METDVEQLWFLYAGVCLMIILLCCHFSLHLTRSSSLPKITSRVWKNRESSGGGGGRRRGKLVLVQESLVRPLDPQITLVDFVVQRLPLWSPFQVQRSRVQLHATMPCWQCMQADGWGGTWTAFNYVLDFLMIHRKLNISRKENWGIETQKARQIPSSLEQPSMNNVQMFIWRRQNEPRPDPWLPHEQ